MRWSGRTESWIAKFIKEDFVRLKRRRELYHDLWSEIIKIFRPRRYDLLGERDKGDRYGTDLFDQSPANSLCRFVSGLIGYMVNKSTPWIQFITSDRRLMELDHIKRFCQEMAEQVLYAAGRSNFYSAVVPAAMDTHSIGTSVQVPTVDEGRDRVVFDTVAPRDSYIGVDRFGVPIIYARVLRLTRLNAEETFGSDKLPEEWYEKGQLKTPLEEDEYLWAVYPNDEYDLDSLDPLDRRYRVFCVLMAKSEKLVYEWGRSLFPTCWRSTPDSGASYGTSIAADCLTSGQVINALGEKGVLAAHLAVEPRKVVSKTLRTTLRENPGGTSFVKDIDREGVRVWGDRLQWPITDAQIQRLQTMIDDRMFIRFFEMLSAGDLKARTAYEVSQMMGEKAVLMTTITDTFEQENIEPNIEFLIRAEDAAGRLPDVPPEVQLAGNRLDINYLGPLPQLQRSLLRSKGIIDALSIIQMMMTMKQEVGWKFDWFEMAEQVAISQGMPQKMIVSDETLRAIQAEVARQKQAAEIAQTAESVGKALPALSKKVEPGSALAGVA